MQSDCEHDSHSGVRSVELHWREYVRWYGERHVYLHEVRDSVDCACDVDFVDDFDACFWRVFDVDYFDVDVHDR